MAIGSHAAGGGSRYEPRLMHQAASLYYDSGATQAEIASRLGVSRPTISRLLTEARRRGIVRIEVVRPDHDVPTDLAAEVAGQLGLQAVHIAPGAADRHPGVTLRPGVHAALSQVDLDPGDVILVSSGRTVHEVVQGELPRLPGVIVVPAIGGQAEPEPWYQPNEIVRQFASRVQGTPEFLYAPALPSPELHAVLVRDEAIMRIPQLWRHARCAVIGVGAPPLLRRSIPRFVPTDAVALRAAVGDVCSRFYDKHGEPISFPGIEQLMATPLDVLQQVPTVIAVAVGHDKLVGVIAGARAGYFTHWVTDESTARRALDTVGSRSG